MPPMKEHAAPGIPLAHASTIPMALDFEISLATAYLKADPGHREALEMLGHALTRRGRHAEALEVDRRLVGLEPSNAYVRYNFACSLSNMDRVDEALRELEKALDLGYDDLALLRSDPDLAGVRKDPRFKLLLRRARDRGVGPGGRKGS